MPMEYRDFDVEAFDYEDDPDGPHFLVRVADSPAGQQRHSQADRVALAPDLRKRVRLLERRKLNLGEMIELGEELANLLLPKRARWFLDRSRAMLDPGEGLRIRLGLDSYALSDLPWEYLYIPGPDTPPDQRGPDGFLVLDRRVSLVRYELMGQAAERLEPVGSGPLRLVALLANPDKPPEYPALNLDFERNNIEKAMSQMPEVEVRFFPEGRVSDLEEALAADPHILHFAGHGEFVGEMGAKFGTQEGKGALVLVGEDGEPEQFQVEKLAQNLVGRSIRLAMFGACKTAQRDQYNAWTGVAPALTRAGIPAVVAMQYAIKDKNAATFSWRFYGALASGETIDAAVAAGRMAIFNRCDLMKERDWGVPVLYLRTSGGQLLPEAEQRDSTPVSKGLPSRGMRSPAEPTRSKAVDKRALRSVMISSFNQDELQALCWDVEGALGEAGIDLSVGLEMVGGGSKTAIVMNLIDYFDRRGYLEYLVEAVRSARPGRI